MEKKSVIKKIFFYNNNNFRYSLINCRYNPTNDNFVKINGSNQRLRMKCYMAMGKGRLMKEMSLPDYYSVVYGYSFLYLFIVFDINLRNGTV